MGTLYTFGRIIYYDSSSGEVLHDTREIQTTDPNYRSNTDDFKNISVLAERVRDTVSSIELAYGDMSEDFLECNSYKVDVTTGTLVFSYPDPNQVLPKPVYQPPLTVQVTTLTNEVTSTQLALADNYEQLLSAQQDATNAQLALADLFELTLSLQAEVTALKGGVS